jgi:putative membrane protein
MTVDKPTEKPITTELARERSRDATERTLMAWIRTALALIGFGFGIGKAQDYLEMIHPGRINDPILGVRIFGGAFIALGVLAVLMAVIQYRHRLSQIRQEVYVYKAGLPLTEVVAACSGLLSYSFEIALIEIGK